MKFRTFRILGLLVVICVFVSAGAGLKYLANQRPAPQPQAKAVAPQPVASAPQPVQRMEPLSTDEVHSRVNAWLEAHPDRQGKTKLVDFLPNGPFRATAIRFPEAEAVKWSNDTGQWSQIRLDLDRDGTDDEKWLVKNGHLYKREVLDRTGKTTASEHFK